MELVPQWRIDADGASIGQYIVWSSCSYCIGTLVPFKTQMASTNLERAGIVVNDRIVDAGLIEEGTGVRTRSNVYGAVSEAIA